MSRPPALTPEQQNAVRRRLAAGEGVRMLAREYGVGLATIQRQAGHTEQIRNVAKTLAHAQAALATLPPAHQHLAVNLAETLRNISTHLAGAASYGSATAHRLAAIANAQVEKIDDANPMESQETLQAISALTKMANEGASLGVALLAAKKDAAPDKQAPAEPVWAAMIGTKVSTEDAE